MRDYKRVVRERYDRQKYGGAGVKNDPYAVINPVGFYGELKAAQILRDFVNMLCETRGRKLDEIKVCDCGCGGGNKTRFLAELFANPDQVYGVEYSKNRLKHCRDMNPLIHYEYADLTISGAGLPFEEFFDGITAFVVFMHFTSRKEILNALKNIYVSLKENGYFLWYELGAKSHEEGKEKNTDSWGFSAMEMDRYARQVGFKRVKESSIYSKIPIINKSTLYLADKIMDIGMLELLEKLPLQKNNYIRIYIKE